MIEKKQVYKCNVCGNVVESVWNGKPDIVCCGAPMMKLEANTIDAAHEKHVPVIERSGNTVKVKIGSTAHPMSPEHYILFIELLSGDQVYRHDLEEGDKAAEATFAVPEGADDLTARAYCNLHGLWASS